MIRNDFTFACLAAFPSSLFLLPLLLLPFSAFLPRLPFPPATMKTLLLALFIASVCERVHSFNLPNIFKPPALPKIQATPSSASKEAELLEAISYTANGKNADLETQTRVLKMVRNLETTYPTSDTLLSNLEEAKILDGDWYLQYTQPSELENVDSSDDAWVPVSAESNIETRKFNASGTVTAAGITVDAASNIPKQSFDIANSRVQNEVMAGIGKITVAGRFRQSSAVPQRAVVAFDTAKIALKLGLTLDIGFLFGIRAALKGTDEAGWVETTYCSDVMRIGRGNKGSLFVLTRDIDAVKN